MFRLMMLSAPAFWLLTILSLVVAALQFVVPLYMMAIYNRILQTQSFESLKLISIIAVVLLLIMGIAEIGRSRLLALMSRRLSGYLNKDVYEAILAVPGSDLGQQLNFSADRPRTEPLQDLRTVTGFVAQGGINTFFDAVFAPIFLIALFIIHPLIGFIGLCAAVVIFSFAFSAEVIARKRVKDVSQAEAQAQATLERSLGQFDAVAAMGMTEPLFFRWRANRAEAAQMAASAQSVVGVLSGLAKATRLTVQMGVLGVGAYLAMTTDYFLAGAIIAASIILGRALAPIDQSISLWRPYVASRQASTRLVALMNLMENQPAPFDLPQPKAELHAEGLTILVPGQKDPLLQNAAFHLGPGDVLGIFGTNGMGKTTLLKAVAGLCAPERGTIALGTIPTRSLSGSDRAKYMGYLPQDVQLLPGTIAENIARFREMDKNALYDAAERANAEEFLQTLPMGYNTPLDAVGLSTGQKQLIGLARAIYGDPILLCLDEPTANLDVFSRARIKTLLDHRKAAGLITVMVTHEDAMLEQCTHLMQMGIQNRRGAARFGLHGEIMKALAAEAKKMVRK